MLKVLAPLWTVTWSVIIFWTPQRCVKKLATHQAHVCSTCFTRVFCAHVRIFVIAHGGVSFFLARNSTGDAGLVFSSISGILRDPVAYVLLHFIWAYVNQGLRFRVSYAILSVAESSS